ncbi:MAG: hypothetical protein CL945_00905 [Dinoroseobacter sp.]|jgi:hypothetical protein|nr:hypothetical protein [Dinoroseobacter sp.]|tara:strand:+ start:849 stop:1682 length:834 start_codon:yes stop_codon:yes gene_type:complete
MTKTIAALAVAMALIPTSGMAQTTQYELVEYEEIEWGALNSARGDASPRAGDLWGDRTGDTATGFLVRFDEGFSSPPHIHNVTYRGLVLDGRVHNDDPEAARMWLSPMSFWTQPAGEDHITAADGAFNVAYIEIDSGPYLVQPSDEAFDNGERPINVEARNLVWLDGSDIEFVPMGGDARRVETAYLWSNEQTGERGSLVRLPNGFTGQIATGSGQFRAITGTTGITYSNPQMPEAKALSKGSYFGSTEIASHQIGCSDEDGCTIYVRTNGAITFVR